MYEDGVPVGPTSEGEAVRRGDQDEDSDTSSSSDSDLDAE